MEKVKEIKKKMSMIVVRVEEETKSEYFENIVEGMNFAHEGSLKGKDEDYYSFLEILPRLKEVKKTKRKTGKSKTKKETERKIEFLPFSLEEMKKEAEKAAVGHGHGTYIALVLEKGTEFGGVSISKRK